MSSKFDAKVGAFPAFPQGHGALPLDAFRKPVADGAETRCASATRCCAASSFLAAYRSWTKTRSIPQRSCVWFRSERGLLTKPPNLLKANRHARRLTPIGRRRHTRRHACWERLPSDKPAATNFQETPASHVAGAGVPASRGTDGGWRRSCALISHDAARTVRGAVARSSRASRKSISAAVSRDTRGPGLRWASVASTPRRHSTYLRTARPAPGCCS